MPPERPPLAGKRLLLLPRYTESGPSSRLRMGQFIPALEAAGATVTVAPFFGEAYLAELFGSGKRSAVPAVKAHLARWRTLATVNADLAWIEKELLPFLPGPFERALALLGVRYVVDFDDAVFHRYDRSPCKPIRWAYGRKFDPLLKGAAAVTAGNSYLGDYAAAHGAKRVVRVPTVVDPDRYPVLPAPGGGKLRLGWIGTPDNARYLKLVADGLRLLQPGVKVTLVTIGAPELSDLPVPHEPHAWTADSEAALLSSLDVGVMPLKDSSYERGKCGYKLIQYMAAGRAVIGSPVGVNCEIVTPEVGFLAETPEEWARAIATLATDKGLRDRMGAAGRARVEQFYSKDVAARILIDLFAAVAK